MARYNAWAKGQMIASGDNVNQVMQEARVAARENLKPMYRGEEFPISIKDTTSGVEVMSQYI